MRKHVKESGFLLILTFFHLFFNHLHSSIFVYWLWFISHQIMLINQSIAPQSCGNTFNDLLELCIETFTFIPLFCKIDLIFNKCTDSQGLPCITISKQTYLVIKQFNLFLWRFLRWVQLSHLWFLSQIHLAFFCDW